MNNQVSQISKQKPRILLVEGRKELGPMLEIIFSYEGFALEIVNIHQETISLEKYKDTNAIILNALDAQTRFICQLFRSNSITRTLPIILVVTQEEKISVENLYPVNAYLVKPLELDKNEPITTLRRFLPSISTVQIDPRVKPFDIMIEDRLKGDSKNG